MFARPEIQVSKSLTICKDGALTPSVRMVFSLSLFYSGKSRALEKHTFEVSVTSLVKSQKFPNISRYTLISLLTNFLNNSNLHYCQYCYAKYNLPLNGQTSRLPFRSEYHNIKVMKSVLDNCHESLNTLWTHELSLISLLFSITSPQSFWFLVSLVTKSFRVHVSTSPWHIHSCI